MGKEHHKAPPSIPSGIGCLASSANLLDELPTPTTPDPKYSYVTGTSMGP